MATVTSVQSGNWSSSLTWGGLLPANGDTVVISAGHTVVFDVDMSSWANGVILRVYGKLVAPTTAGTYYLKLAGNSTVYNGGKIEWGTQQSPVPVTVNMTLDFNNYALDGDSSRGQLEIVCTDPPDNAKVAKFTAAVSAGATRIYIDRDLRGQTYWQAGAYIFMTNPNRGNSEYKTISAVGENYIDLSSGLSTSKTSTAVLALCTRNIIFKNMLTGANASITNFASAIIAVYAESGERLYTGNSYTLNIVGGAYKIGGTLYSALISQTCTVSNSVFVDVPAFDNATYVYLYNSYLIGARFITVAYTLIFNNCKMINCDGIQQSLCTILYNCEISNVAYIQATSGLRVYQCTITSLTSVHRCEGVISNSTFDATSMIVDSKIVAKNTVMPPVSTNFAGCYVISYDHNQSAGMLKAWSVGGYCDSISDPYGGSETGWIKLTLNSSSQYGYWEKMHTVLPTKRVTISLKSIVTNVSDARIQIINVSNDPLMDMSASALAEVSLTGNDTITWRNTTSLPMQIAVRVTGKSANGDIKFKITRWS